MHNLCLVVVSAVGIITNKSSSTMEVLMRRFEGTFEELAAKLRAEVEQSSNGQSLHLVGDGILIHDDKTFGEGGLGWCVWFDAGKWAFQYEKKPKAEAGCLGLNFGCMEGTQTEILGEILEKVKRRWLSPIPIGKWWQHRKQYAQIFHEDLWETTGQELQ